jgi:hypothetical protein
MPSIQLKHGECLFDDEDAPKILPFVWYSIQSSDKRRVYALTKIAGRTVYMHRMVQPSINDVDHINGNGLDNRRVNLRGASRSQNMANGGSKGGTSQYKGVSRYTDGRKWQANVMVNRKSHYLGIYEDEAEAARAYDRAAFIAWGKHARLNFPEDMYAAG